MANLGESREQIERGIVHNEAELPLLQAAADSAGEIQAAGPAVATDLGEAATFHASRQRMIADSIAGLGGLRETIGDAREKLAPVGQNVSNATLITHTRNTKIDTAAGKAGGATAAAEQTVGNYSKAGDESRQASEAYAEAAEPSEEPTRSAQLHERSVEHNASLSVRLVTLTDDLEKRLGSLGQVTEAEAGGEDGLRDISSRLGMLQAALGENLREAEEIMAALRSHQERHHHIASALARVTEVSRSLQIPAQTIASQAKDDRSQAQHVISEAEARRDSWR